MGAEVTGSISALLILVVFCLSCISSLDIRLPPAIIDPPIESKIFRIDESVTLNCVASGVPKPEYEWLINGKILTPHAHQNIHYLTGGTIEIRPLTSLDAGVYQCLASNQHGKTYSRPSVLELAMGPVSSSSTGPETIRAEHGKPLTIICKPAKCFPKPSYSWALSPSDVSPEQSPILLSSRVQMDQNGNLHFAYVEASDVQSDKLYKCNIFNPYSDVTKGTSYTKLIFQQDGSPITNFGPEIKFASDPNTIALEGTNVSLRCFFAGYPLPEQISWSSDSGIYARGRIHIINQNTELVIRHVTQADKETYYCKSGVLKHSIHLDVQAVPVFRSIESRPHDVNATEGDTVTVVCDAYAIPPANVTWFINGAELRNENLPPRLQIVNKTHLTVSRVCRDCPDGSSDIRVIQCNASNMHGAAYSSGFINVLKKTEMTAVPVDVTVNASDTFASFNCSGTSDDSTPVSVRWYKLSDTGNNSPVKEIPQRVVVERNGTLSFFLLSNKSSWTEHAGRYSCIVSNGYSVQWKDVQLMTLEEDKPVLVGAAFPWWIILIALLVLILLLLLVCCCCYLRRNRGATYLVDEKERKSGLDPDKELADNGFQDYVQPYQKLGVRASPPSLRKSLSDDEMSLNEYGDIDAGKFTEDGSFIGDYNDRPYV